MLGRGCGHKCLCSGSNVGMQTRDRSHTWVLEKQSETQGMVRQTDTEVSVWKKYFLKHLKLKFKIYLISVKPWIASNIAIVVYTMKAIHVYGVCMEWLSVCTIGG